MQIDEQCFFIKIVAVFPMHLNAADINKTNANYF